MTQTDTSEWSPLDQARFRSLVEETVLPPANSTELADRASLDYQNRLDRPSPHVGESFIVNTRLHRRSPYAARPNPREVSEVWRLLRDMSYAPNAEDLEAESMGNLIVHHDTLDPPLRGLLHTLVDPTGLGQIFVGVDAFVVIEGTVYRQPVGRPFLWKERDCGPAGHAKFEESILDRPERVHNVPWLVLVGAPWRHMMFYGPRGLRRTLLDAGRAIMAIGSVGNSLGFSPWVGVDLYDSDAESILLIDGVERFVVAAIALLPEPSHA